MLLLEIGEPFGGSALHLGAGRGDGVAESQDLGFKRVHQRSHRGAGAEAGEAEHGGLTGRAGGMARPHDHQVRQLGHHRGIALADAEEGRARQGHEFGVAQGHHRGRVGRAGDHGHLSGRLAWSDHAQELGLLALVAAHHAQPTGQQEVQLVRLLAGVEQHPPAGQREPRHLRRAFRADEQPRQGGVLDVLRQADHLGTLA